MLVVLEFKTIQFLVAPGEHGWPSIYVQGRESEAGFRIDQAICLSNDGFSKKSIEKLSHKILEHQDLLLEAWDECRD